MNICSFRIFPRLPLLFTVNALALFGAATAGASDTVLIVPRQATQLEISQAALAAGGGHREILSWNPPSRGTVSSIADGFLYAPGPAFVQKGSDSFRYRYSSGGVPAVATVFLLADLAPSLDDDRRGETTAGGNTALVLDIDPGCTSGTTCDVPPGPLDGVVATALDADGGVRFEVGTTVENGAASVWVRARETGGGAVVTPAVALEAGQRELTLDWWYATPGARNGGVLLRVGGVLAASSTGVDNPGSGSLAWHFPAGEQSTQPRIVAVPRVSERGSGLPLAFPPRFADTFEGVDLNAWELPPNENDPPAFQLGSAAVVDGAQGLAIDLGAPGPKALYDSSPMSVERYRARFELRTGGACALSQAAEPVPVVLLEGLAQGGSAPLFRLLYEPVGAGAFRLVLQGLDELAGIVSTTPTDVLSGRATIDVEWWSATDPRAIDGGVALRRGGQTAPSRDLVLANGAHRLDGVELGAIDAPPGLTGTLCLDELEAWW